MKKKNIFLSFLVVLILLVTGLLVSRITYSFMEPEVPDDVILESGVTATGDTIVFTKAEDIVGTLDQSTFGGTSGNYVRSVSPQVKLIASPKTNNATATYYISISIEENTFQYTNGTNNPEILLTVLDENSNAVTTSIDSLNYVTVGNVSGFDITNKVGVFDIKTDTIETNSSTTGTTKTWTYTITFINKTTDQSINESAVIKIKPVLHKDQETFCEINPNNIGCKYVSNFDPTNPSTLYYHGSSLTNGANDGSYRFAGANPNNYICFGSDASTCPNDNIYRIIGIIPVEVVDDSNPNNVVITKENLVKIIKNDYATSTEIGMISNGNAEKVVEYAGVTGNQPSGAVEGFSWSGTTGNHSNTWSNSTLNTTGLNINYYGSFNSTWQNKIAKVNWMVGGRSLGDVRDVSPMSVVYKNEMNPVVIANLSDDMVAESINRIGLIYISDYGYSAVQNAWAYRIHTLNNDNNSYAKSDIISNNWLYKGVTEALLTRYNSTVRSIFYITNIGNVTHGYSNVVYGIRPTFYLTSNTVIDTSHAGTISDPYRIS